MTDASFSFAAFVLSAFGKIEMGGGLFLFFLLWRLC